MKKYFIFLCMTMFTTNMFAGVRQQVKSQEAVSMSEYVDTDDGSIVIPEEEVPL